MDNHCPHQNGQLGKITKEQKAGEWPVWETDLHNPSFAAFAKLCGGYGQRVNDNTKLTEALQDALAVDGQALVEVMSDAEVI